MAVTITAESLLTIPPQSSGLQTVGLFILFFLPALALVIVITRCAGRFATGQFGWDDGLICIAMLMSVLETAASYFFIKLNFTGIPGRDIPRRFDPTPGLVWNYAVQILYNPILALVKSSVLLFLLRLFGQKDWVRRTIHVLNVINLAQMVGVFFAILFQCMPIAFNWDPSIRGGRCVDRRVLYTTNAAFNILTDLLVLGLPLIIFYGLKIPRKTKIALLFVFLLGFLVTIASIVRLVILVQGLFMLITLEDPTYNIGFVTSAIETNLALITASVPALTPLLRTWFPSWFGGGPSGGNGVTKNNYVDIPPKGTMQPIRRINLRDLKRDNGSLGSRGIAELRSHSPSRSEEEMMTMNGIVRTTDMAVNGDIGMSRQYPTQQQPQMSRYDGGYSRPAFADPPRSRGAPSAGWEPDPGAMGQSRYMDRNRF